MKSARRRLAVIATVFAGLLGQVTGLNGWAWDASDNPNALPEAGATEPEIGEAATVEPFPVLFVNGDCDSYRFIASMVWPEIDTRSGPSWGWVKKIMFRESTCLVDPPGSNDSGNSFGLMQIHVPWRFWDKPIGWGVGPVNAECGLTAREDLLNPAVNIACARVLWNARGYAPWA